MSDSPLVSIILCVRNGMPHVRDAVESVRAQTYANYELVIQDAASTDGTLDYFRGLTGFPAMSLVSEPDSGQGEGFNRAVKRCRGEIVGSVDADNRLRPAAVETAVRAFAAHPGAAAVYGACDMIDAGGAFLHSFLPAQFDLLGLLDGSIVPPFGSTFFSRAVCGSRLYFDDDFPVVGDFALWLRLAGLRILRVFDVLMEVRAGPQSSTYQPGSYDQQTHFKIKAATRFLNGPDARHALDALAVRAEAGVFLWAVDSMQVIGGPRERINEFFRKAVGGDVRSEQFRAVVTRARPVLDPLEPETEEELLACAREFSTRIEPQDALVYLELLERSGSRLPELPALIADARHVEKEIHLAHCQDVIVSLQDEVTRRDTLLVSEIAIRDTRLVDMMAHMQAEVDLRDRLLEEARDTFVARWRDRLRIGDRVRALAGGAKADHRE
jgi:hypothetical protein